MPTRTTQNKFEASGFTLIELLVVIAIIAILAAMLLPTLAKSKAQSQGIKCISNLKELTLAWTMYNGDNRENFVVNGNNGDSPGGTANAPTPGVNPQWCPDDMSQGAAVPGEQISLPWLEAGLMYPYVGSPGVYRCPADSSTYKNDTVYPTSGPGTNRLRDIAVRTDLAAGLPQIAGDRVQLQQVAMNLIVNSIEAMKEIDGMREIVIQTRRAKNEQILVSFTDTGMGLPPELADQIFDPFFTTKPNGTGMGLRISRSIVESHGGRLWAESAAGGGATFHLSLPVSIPDSR